MKIFRIAILGLLLVSSSVLFGQATRWDAYKTQISQFAVHEKASSWSQAELVRQSLAVGLESDVQARLLAFRKYVSEAKGQAAVAEPITEKDREANAVRTARPASDELAVLKQRSNRIGELLYFVHSVKVTDAASANLVRGYATELVGMLAADEKAMTKK